MYTIRVPKIIQFGKDAISEAEKKAEKEVSAISGNLFHRSDIGTESLIQKKIKQMSLIR